MKGWILSLILISLLIVAGEVAGQDVEFGTEVTTAEEASEWLMQLYNTRDYELGALEGDRLIEKFSGSVRVEAMRIINMARGIQTKDAVDAASVLIDQHPGDEWAIYAKAVALRWDEDRREEALDYINRGLEAAPEKSEFHSLHIAWLNTMDKKEEAWERTLHYLDITDNPVKILEMKGFMENQLANDRDDITQEDKYITYQRVRDKDPKNLSAHYFPGIYYMNAGQMEEALELLGKAAEISTAPEVSSRYWQTLIRDDNYSQEEKVSIITGGIDSLKERRPETPAMLMVIANSYNMLGMQDERSVYAERILEQYNDSPEAEWMLVQRYRDYRQKYSDEIQQGDREIISEYKAMLWDFVNRDDYHNPNLQGDSYLTLFGLYRQEESPNPDTLRIILEGAVTYNDYNPHLVFAEFPASYAEKGGDTDRALEIANRGFDEMKQSVERRKEWGAFSSDEDYREALDQSFSVVHNAIGWIYYHDGDLEKAEEHLVKSHDLESEGRVNLYRLGQLYERLNQPENAESYYVMGMGTTGMGENPNEEALKELYEKTRGSLDGYDNYLERVLAGDRETRRERLLADRHDNPEAPPAFELNDISGNSVSSDLMDGKIVAINFWGKWCGPCVAEMPYIQELHEQYKEDDDVLILTINNDPVLGDLIEWMKEHEYTFPTLRDNGYIETAGVSAFPTTWFLDRSGNIIYTQRGYTSELVEEFTWRIEALR